MKIRVNCLTKKEWKLFSEEAHKVAFDRKKPADWDRIDFALFAIEEATRRPMAYVTCREMDAETLYWQFGGAFPGTIGTIHSFGCYEQFLAWCGDKYSRVTTLIANDNLVMLKMAMKVGFRIQGIRYYGGDVLLEHVVGFRKEATGAVSVGTAA